MALGPRGLLRLLLGVPCSLRCWTRLSGGTGQQAGPGTVQKGGEAVRSGRRCAPHLRLPRALGLHPRAPLAFTPARCAWADTRTRARRRRRALCWPRGEAAAAARRSDLETPRASRRGRGSDGARVRPGSAAPGGGDVGKDRGRSNLALRRAHTQVGQINGGAPRWRRSSACENHFWRDREIWRRAWDSSFSFQKGKWKFSLKICAPK